MIQGSDFKGNRLINYILQKIIQITQLVEEKIIEWVSFSSELQILIKVQNWYESNSKMH